MIPYLINVLGTVHKVVSQTLLEDLHGGDDALVGGSHLLALLAQSSDGSMELVSVVGKLLAMVSLLSQANAELVKDVPGLSKGHQTHSNHHLYLHVGYTFSDVKTEDSETIATGQRHSTERLG